MNIGDRVRSVSSSEEGIVTRFITVNEVEVEIEDGFRIPYLRNDLVVVSATEKTIFGDKQEASSIKHGKQETEKEAEVTALKGIFIGFTHYNDKLLELHLVNNTDFQLGIVFCEEENKAYHGVYSGSLPSREYVKIHEVNIDKFERWPAFIFQIIYFKRGKFNLPSPLLSRVKFKANSFFKHKKEIPLVSKEGYCFQLDEEEKLIDPEKLKESLAGGKSAHLDNIYQRDFSTKRQSKKEVDLHIEQLETNHSHLFNAQIIAIQLEHFEHELDQAIINGLDEIVFIHGVGAGVLKAAISKRLSGHQHVAFYKDAYKGKFGYGATSVKIK